MLTTRKDWLERLIEEMTEALRRVVAARKAEHPEEALELIREAGQRLLGLEYQVLTSIDARSAALLLGHAEKVRALAQLVREEAETLRALGRAAEADARAAQAEALEREAS